MKEQNYNINDLIKDMKPEKIILKPIAIDPYTKKPKKKKI